jgi:hypothetical protein
MFAIKTLLLQQRWSIVIVASSSLNVKSLRMMIMKEMMAMVVASLLTDGRGRAAPAHQHNT